MTIDEAIKHAEEVADFCEDSASKYDMTDAFESYMACEDGKCASEHRQLAEWLKELKEIREQTRWILVKWHIKTEVEEYEQYPEGAVMLDCPMPEEKEEVLITIKGKNGQVWVEKDVALKDEEGWYTDGGYDWVDDIIAWMPLPNPYRGGESE